MKKLTNRSLLVMSVLVVFMFAVFCFGFAEKEMGQPIKLGFVNMRTGFGSIHALHAYRAVKLAVDEINERGGLLERELILIEEDSHTEVDPSNRTRLPQPWFLSFLIFCMPSLKWPTKINTCSLAAG
jgi:hypothetical protein